MTFVVRSEPAAPSSWREAGATKEAVADATGLSLEEAEAIVTFHGRNSG